jgi:predicted ATPase/two-component sensor histidine kinase
MSTVSRHESIAVEFRSDGDAPALELPHSAGATPFSSLSSIQRSPLALARILRIGVGLASTLEDLHASGNVHGALQPKQVEIVGESGVRLRASPVDDGPGLESRSIGSGRSLGYIAPEQVHGGTRTIDARTDLYATGCILYELLTGVLPFPDDDPHSCLHGHIARRPLAAHERSTGVPRGVSAIVDKLLSKAAEDRYQTAGGLRRDLDRCLYALESTGRIDQFVLADSDVAVYLHVPDRLYGRAGTVSALLDGFYRVLRTGRRELIFVSGASGVGKTAAVRAFSHQLPPGRSLFAAGKFERGQAGIPYRTLALGLGGLVEQMLLGSDGSSEGVDQLRDAVAESAPLMVGLIPQLAAVVGSRPPGVDYPATELQPRFWAALKRLIRVFALDNRPVVLFLDDLQWADLATLALLTKIARDEDVRNVLIVGSYRDAEVQESGALSAVRGAWREAGMDPLDLRLEPLHLEDIASLLSDSLQSTWSTVQPLAALILDQTSGNAFMVRHLLRQLSTDGLLARSADSGQWRWDVVKIGGQSYGANAGDVLSTNVRAVGATSLSALQVLACLGNSSAADLISRAIGQEVPEVRAALEPAVAKGLVTVRGGVYSFLHDRMRETVYQTVPTGSLPTLHARIGMNLAGDRVWTEEDEEVFEVVTQLNRGAAMLKGEKSPWLARLNAAAGARARKTGAYGPALGYFEAAGEAIGSARGHEDRSLGFTVELRRAECEFLLGSIAEAEERLAKLAAGTADLADAGKIAWTRITLDTAAGRFNRAIDTALAYLQRFGVKWSARPSRADLDREFEPIAKVIAKGAIESLIDLPVNTHEESKAALDVLAATLPPAFFTDNTLVCLILCRMVNLSLERGASAASSLAYAYLGMVLGPFFDNYEAGYRFGRLGLALALDHGFDLYAARVSMCFGAHVLPFTQPLEGALPHLRRAFAAADRAGDLTYAGFSACTTATNLLAAGTHLAVFQREAESKLAYVRRARFGLIEDIITTQLQLARSLAGVSPDAMSLEDSTFSEKRFEKHLSEDPQLVIATCWYWIRKAQHRVFVGDHAAALDASIRAEPLLWTTGGHFEFVEFHVFSALARTLAWDHASEAERPELRATAERLHSQIRVWERNCASTFAHRAALVAGELARISGDQIGALRCFEKAAREAGDCDLLGALALERAGHVCAIQGLGHMSSNYRWRAREAYRRCGAEGMVRKLTDRESEAWRDQLPQEPDREAVALGDADLSAVVRSFEALTEEAVVDTLVRKLMIIALQYAGAERGLLIMQPDADPVVKAEARTGEEGVDVRIASSMASASDLPLSVLSAVVSAREAIKISDAVASHAFYGDPYFSERKVRSVLCLPLIRQKRVTGVLFLENGMLPNVFDGARIAVLKIMASQAAIALENALLGEKEALLKEVHHRVKNNLQLVSSLLNLQAAQIPDPKVAELFNDSRNRVRAMALVHENLYRAGNFSSVAMADHVRALCAHLMRAYGGLAQNVRLEVQAGTEIRLDVDRAVSCGLIINELVSNALKHAFPSGGPGLISVGLSLKSGRHCILSISDDGVGLQSAIESDGGKTLGLQLVYDLAAQLEGAVDCYYNNGTFFSVTFPLSRTWDLKH